MSDLKFRVWNPRYKSFNYWGFINGHFIGVPTGSGMTIEECSKSLRFSSLKDSKGVEIYEGDRLFVCAGYSSIVEFQDGCFVSVYKHPEDGEVIPLSEIIGKDTEVIGNIYQDAATEIPKA